MFNVEIWGTVADWVMIVVTLTTAILLYAALIKQIEASKQQRVKNDSDVIFLLINQLEIEYNNFSVTYTERTGNQPSVVRIKHGYDGLSTYYKALRNDDRPERLQGVKDDLATDNLLSLIRSFMLVRERVNQSTLPEETKTLFYQKLRILYKTKFEFPMDCINIIG